MRGRGVEEHERRIQGVFRKAWVDNGWSAAVDETPLDVLLEEEYDADRFSDESEGVVYWPSREASESERMELRGLKAEEAAAVAAWARERLVQWILGDGLHPFRIVQRFYALLYARYQGFLGPIANETWLAEILNQGRAAFSAVMKRLFTRPVKIKTGVMMLSPGMKSEASRPGYAANARKNTPRRHHDAKRLDPRAEAKALKEQKAAQAAKLKAARDGYERRRLAELAGVSPDEIDLEKCNPYTDDDDEN